MKYVTFENDMSFTVRVGKTVIDLKSNFMLSSFQVTKESIKNVCKQIDLIQVCQGIPLNNRDYKRADHIIEEILSYNNDENGYRVLRSTHCKMVANFIGKGHPK